MSIVCGVWMLVCWCWWCYGLWCRVCVSFFQFSNIFEFISSWNVFAVVFFCSFCSCDVWHWVVIAQCWFAMSSLNYNLSIDWFRIVVSVSFFFECVDGVAFAMRLFLLAIAPNPCQCFWILSCLWRFTVWAICVFCAICVMKWHGLIIPCSGLAGHFFVFSLFETHGVVCGTNFVDLESCVIALTMLTFVEIQAEWVRFFCCLSCHAKDRQRLMQMGILVKHSSQAFLHPAWHTELACWTNTTVHRPPCSVQLANTEYQSNSKYSRFSINFIWNSYQQFQFVRNSDVQVVFMWKWPFDGVLDGHSCDCGCLFHCGVCVLLVSDWHCRVQPSNPTTLCSYTGSWWLQHGIFIAVLLVRPLDWFGQIHCTFGCGSAFSKSCKTIHWSISCGSTATYYRSTSCVVSLDNAHEYRTNSLDKFHEYRTNSLDNSHEYRTNFCFWPRAVRPPDSCFIGVLANTDFLQRQIAHEPA